MSIIEHSHHSWYSLYSPQFPRLHLHEHSELLSWTVAGSLVGPYSWRWLYLQRHLAQAPSTLQGQPVAPVAQLGCVV